MKKHYFGALAIFTLLMASCSQEEQFFNENAKDVFSGEIISSNSRTSLGEGGKTIWSEGDAINLFQKSGFAHKFVVKNGDGGKTTADFAYGGVSEDLGNEFTQHYAAYPYKDNTTIVEEENSATINLDLTTLANQKYVAGTFDPAAAVMVAKSSNLVLPFTNALSMAKVNLSMQKPIMDAVVYSVKVISTDLPLTGEATVDMTLDKQPAVIASNGGKEITLTTGENGVTLGNEPTSFYIMVPAGIHDAGKFKLEFEVSLNRADIETLTKEYTEVINFQRSTIETFNLVFDDFGKVSASTEENVQRVEDATKANEALQENPKVQIKDVTGATADEPITIPAKESDAAAETHVIDLSLATLPTDAPVYITVEEANEGATEKTVKELEVIIPESATTGSLNIVAPGTTVTIKAANGTVIETIEAVTAENTLIIESGVTVNNLIVKGGNVEVYGKVGNISRSEGNEDAQTYIYLKEGAVVENYAADDANIFVIGTNGEELVCSQAQLQRAIDANVAEINVGGNIVGNVTVTQKAEIQITINGNGKNFNGVITVDGKSATYTTAGLTIKDLNFAAESISADACIRLGDDTNATRYTCNVTVDNCTFDVPGAVGIKSYTGGDKNLTITGCTATTKAHSLVQAKGIDGVFVQNCTVNSKNGMNFNNSTNVTVDNCTTDVRGYAARFGESNGGSGAAEVYTIKNSTLKSACEDGDAVIILRGTADNSTLNIENTTLEGTTKITNNASNAKVFINGIVSVSSAEELASALKAEVENISVILINNIDLPINTLGQQTGGSGEYKLGGENTQNITIDLNGNKLNITTTYWSVLGAKNADALFTIKNGTMTSSQASGTWNSYDLCFANCNYVFENVVFDKAIALEGANKEYTLKNVTINETHDYYAIWVSAKGQNVNINGLTVNSAGRGVKIDEQYVSAPAKVTMNVANATFNTVKKAAIVVKSVEGAEITWGAGNNIDNVAADNTFAVWVDENSKDYADKVVVNGVLSKVEGAASVLIYTADDLNNLKATDAYVVLKADIDFGGAAMTKPIEIWKNCTFDGQGHKISNVKTAVQGGYATSLFRGDANSGNKVIKNLIIENLTTPTGYSYASAIWSDLQGANIEIDNVHINNATIEAKGTIGGFVGFVSGSTTSVVVKNSSINNSNLNGGEADHKRGAVVGRAYGCAVTCEDVVVNKVKINDVAATTSTLVGDKGYTGTVTVK